MHEHGVHAWLIPSADPHLSEYLPAHWQIRQWLTGFTGSVGTVVVTPTFAGLWVDSRYWDQAQKELADSGVVLQRTTANPDSSHVSWLAHTLDSDAVLAVDGRALALGARDALTAALPATVMLRLDLDIAEQIWPDRPALPQQPIWALPEPFAHQTRAEKLALVREHMHAQHANQHFISTLDDIAWVLNLRGSDVAFNPIFLAHLLIGPSQAILFVAPEALSAELRAALATDGVTLAPYSQALQAVTDLRQTDCLLIDPKRITSAFVSSLAASTVSAMNPSTRLKACKQETEIAHWRQTMITDGQALCEFFAELEQAVDARHDVPLSEHMIDEAVTRRRAQAPSFVSRSFATIAAFNANAAMPHYHATATGSAPIVGEGLLLIDSGGQYLGGTTDITRMVPIGEPSLAQRQDCTAVLQGMIAMSRLRFPAGTPAPLLDAVARAPIWQRSLDYGHGTGHGVGYFLNVHEGPQVLAFRAPATPDTALWAGMVTSNEPGLYRAGQWGVRIENLLCCHTVEPAGFGDFLGFETLTLCPIDTRCFELSLLRVDERQWLNNYHETVRKQLAPGLSPAATHWLLARTEPVPL
jgi:Xaa-Pro aminopeptidase